MTSLSNDTQRVPEFAYYYGDFFWNEELTGWVKSLLLFFDGIALALPPLWANELMERDPVLAQPLADLGLLRFYGPDQWYRPWERSSYSFNVLAAGGLTDVYEAFLAQRKLTLKDVLLFQKQRRTLSKELDFDLLHAALSMVFGEKESFGYGKEDFARLDRRSPHGRAVLMSIISMFLRRYVTDIAIEPVINDENAAYFAASMIGPRDRGRADIVRGDLAHIGIDLSAVPLDEVLDYRSKYGSEY